MLDATVYTASYTNPYVCVYEPTVKPGTCQTTVSYKAITASLIGTCPTTTLCVGSNDVTNLVISELQKVGISGTLQI